MNQVKIGLFLKQLRKEKNMTQESLAEYFNISGRSVSRWETGHNLPDLAMLVELSDYYDVDISEIILGERKSENMNKEEKEKLNLIAEYAENEKEDLIRTLRKIGVIGMLVTIGAMLYSFWCAYQGAYVGGDPVVDNLIGIGFVVAFGVSLCVIVYTTILIKNTTKDK